MDYPRVKKGAKICVFLKRKELWFYGNKKAFTSLSNIISWLAKLSPKKMPHHHLELFMNLYGYQKDKKARQVWLFSKVRKDIKFNSKDFSISFMMLEDKHIDKMIKLKSQHIFKR